LIVLTLVMQKGFTFTQMAVLLLVILGLVVSVVLAATQFRQAGGSITDVGEQATGGSQAAGESVAGLVCDLAGGECKASCSASQTDTGTSDCPSTAAKCCVPK